MKQRKTKNELTDKTELKTTRDKTHNRHEQATTPVKSVKYELRATTQMRTINEKSDKTDKTKANCLNTIRSFERFLAGADIMNVWNSINYDTFEAYERYMQSNNASQATIKVYFDNLKALCRIAGKDRNIDFSFSAIEGFEPKKNKANKTLRKNKQVDLTEGEIKRIYEYKSDNNKENEVRDIFVLQCELGQRIGDMDKFVKGGYKLNEKLNTITIIQHKTNEIAIMPVSPIAAELLKRYKDGLKYNKDLSDKSTQFYINKHIKEIARKVGITDMVTYQEDKGGKVITIEKPKCERIRTHTARHTFVTISCRRGIQKDIIKIATGHSDDTMIDEVYSHQSIEDREKQVSEGYGTKATNDNKAATKTIEDTVAKILGKEIITKKIEALKNDILRIKGDIEFKGFELMMNINKDISEQEIIEAIVFLKNDIIRIEKEIEGYNKALDA
jgi:integrase